MLDAPRLSAYASRSMPLLDSETPLSHRPARVVVAGTTGAGKSTLARRIGELLGLPYTEMDALFHGPGWTPRASFVEDVRALVDAPRWVTEFQYDAARPLLAERADLFVWLDLPRSLVMARVVRRTLGRALRGEVLWNENREPPLRTFFTDRDHVVRWAWRTHGDNRARMRAIVAARPDLPVVRLRTAREVERWMAGPLHRLRA